MEKQEKPGLLARVVSALKPLTVVGGIAVTLLLFVLFDYSPLDKVLESRDRKKEVDLHTKVAYAMLQRGHYAIAKREFKRALDRNPQFRWALGGDYLADLFLEMDTPAWEPSVGSSIFAELKNFPVDDMTFLERWSSRVTGAESVDRQGIFHAVRLKYMGDAALNTGDLKGALSFYDEALQLNPSYVDALYSSAWATYSYSPQPDPVWMEDRFRRMISAEPNDYRGFHGLGYALYIRALSLADPAARGVLLEEAGKQSQKATHLRLNRLNVTMDFGEIVRPVRPETSLTFHQYALELMDDAESQKVRDNQASLGARLLTTGGDIRLDTREQKQAWIKYQLALDYLAMAWKGEGDDESMRLHNTLLREAERLDSSMYVRAIYDDQHAILECVSPRSGTPREKACTGAAK